MRQANHAVLDPHAASRPALQCVMLKECITHAFYDQEGPKNPLSGLHVLTAWRYNTAPELDDHFLLTRSGIQDSIIHLGEITANGVQKNCTPHKENSCS